jgi:hypothetical protein
VYHYWLLLVVGPSAVTSEYLQQEWQFAWFEAEKVVTPILRQGDYPLALPELALLQAEDFRDDAQYAVHLKELIRILNDPPPTLGKLIGVPSLPAHYLSRTDRLIPLRNAVRSGLDSRAPFGGAAARQKLHGIAGTSKQVGMHGMGGIGKSVLANLLAHDREIRKAFPDGIVWVGLGSVPILLDLMRRVHKDRGGDGAFATEHEGKLKLKELLADKALLLIIDDAWRREGREPAARHTRKLLLKPEPHGSLSAIGMLWMRVRSYTVLYAFPTQSARPHSSSLGHSIKLMVRWWTTRSRPSTLRVRRSGSKFAAARDREIPSSRPNPGAAANRSGHGSNRQDLRGRRAFSCR